MFQKQRLSIWIGALTAFLIVTSSVSVTAQLEFPQEGEKPEELSSGVEGGDHLLNLAGAGEDNLSPGAGPSAESESLGQRMHNLLFKELSNTIPEAIANDEELKKALANAITAFQLQDFNRVMEIFNGEEERIENFPPADFLMAILSFTVRDNKTGLLLLERAAIKRPEYPGTYVWFSKLAIRQRRLTDALAILEKLERLIDQSEYDDVVKKYYHSSCVDGFVLVAMRQQRYEDARKFLELQRSMFPNSPRLIYISAELEFRENNIESSLNYLKQFRDLVPKSQSPELILANWYQKIRNADEYEKWLRTAAEKYQADAQTQFQYAILSFNQEDIETASSTIEKVENMTRETLATRNLKGKIAFFNGAYDVAESYFQIITEQQPKNFDAANLYALCLIESDDETKWGLAKEIATRNFRALPNNFVSQAALGYISFKMGDIEQAKTVLNNAAKTTLPIPEIDYYLALLAKETGDVDKAKSTIERTIKHKGIFLYRSKAQQLLKELGGTTEEVIEPGTEPESDPPSPTP